MFLGIRLCSACVSLTQHPQLGRESTCFLLHLSIKRVLRSENTRFSRSRRRSEKQDFHVGTSVWLGRQIYAFGYWIWCSSPPCPPFLDATSLCSKENIINISFSGSNFVFQLTYVSCLYKFINNSLIFNVFILRFDDASNGCSGSN